MLFSTVERELLRLVRNLEKENKPAELFEPRKGSLVTPVTKFCKEHFKLPLDECSDFQSLGDLQLIRNCLVHCRGEVALFDKQRRGHLIGMKNRRTGFNADEGTVIEIESCCIEEFAEQVATFFLCVFNRLGWEVDNSWRTEL